ncbi:ATP-binding protein [Paraburkholderia sp.]|uniref:ATP-binding protein n=1 Tax=Paraburkholderia sp. TaxID=1926495 RepID=UPI002B000D3B|nr:ATP-binding protein [Paraburkholderia sp.]
MSALGSSRQSSTPGYLIGLWIGGCVALAVIAGICFDLQVRLATTGFCMLIAVVLLSLLDSFVSSVIFSVVGAALLNVLFTPPIFSFQIEKLQEVFPLAAFLITSLAVTTLVRRIRRMEQMQRGQARLLDLTHDTVFVRDTAGVIIYWNHAAEVLYGWSKAEATGKAADELLKTIFPAPRDEVQRMLLRDGHWEGELTHTRRDGSQVIVASRWTLQHDDKNAPLATLETNNDITGRKRAEEMLRRSQAQYLAEAQKLSRTGSFGWNIATGEIFWSEEAFAIFEQDPASAPCIETIRARVHPEDLHVFERMLQDVGETADGFDIEHRLLFPDGRVKHLHVVAHRAEGQSNRRQFIGALMDVTQAKQTEARLQEAQNELARASRITALGELSASIAHEVGQPLAAIVTNGEACLRWLRREPLNMEEIEGCVTQITDEGNRAAGIVQRVRMLMKGAPPERTAVGMNQLIEEAAKLIRAEVERQAGALVLSLGSNLPDVLADRVQLQQVLINLIVNGMQSMSAVGGRREMVVISTSDPEGNVVVSVRDSGPGISEQNLPRLFDAFFTTRSTGMGMGLAICSSIIEAHGGQIWAANNPEGGATFSFSLPAATARAALT